MDFLTAVVQLRDQHDKLTALEQSLRSLAPYAMLYHEFTSVQHEFARQGIPLVQANHLLVEWYQKGEESSRRYEEWKENLLTPAINDKRLPEIIRQSLASLD